ncbi:RNA polymerase sigma factor SigM [Parafrankia discariae]|uniref:RNA polymerase sigma factor SigM n=1 Tax=Parafrankia discariae TaxID=365528 RepID=UPI000377DD26|nr:RNA polymerase sigma factor SigM [Parafrankia discariae]
MNPPAATGARSSGRAPAADLEALRRHVAGDPAAFGELFRAHADRLWSVAFALLQDTEEAADAVQEAMLSAHRRAADFRGEAAVGTWLHRIVTNAALDRLRRRAVRPTVPMPSTPDGVPYEPPDTRDAIAEHDTRMDIGAALGMLPVTLRTPVVLVDVEGRPVAEVAELLDIPVGTVKSRCARGRARLAVLLGHLAPEGARRPAAGNQAASPSVCDEGRYDTSAGGFEEPADQSIEHSVEPLDQPVGRAGSDREEADGTDPTGTTTRGAAAEPVEIPGAAGVPRPADRTGTTAGRLTRRRR